MELPKKIAEKHKRVNTEEDEVHPRWLTSLLTSQFYEPCMSHNYEKCNFFCQDCNGPKAIFCGSCYKGHEERHPHHHVFQVYKVSHYPGIKLKEIEKFYDISDIHPYSFNSKKIIYIRSRPRKGHGNRNHHSLNKNCQECGRELPSEEDVFKFCSIGCKLFNNKGQKFEPKKDEQTQRTRCPIPICNLNFRRRRRKGKPQRAPFF